MNMYDHRLGHSWLEISITPCDIIPPTKMAPIQGYCGFGGGATNLARGGVPDPCDPFVLSGWDSGVQWAFSGDNTACDVSGNGEELENMGSFSTTQKKWGSYSHSIALSGDTASNILEVPAFTPSASGWSLEWWMYVTAWGGKYAMHTGSGGISWNVQPTQFRMYNDFADGVVYWNSGTSGFLNDWKFFQIYYDPSANNVYFKISGTQYGNISGNAGNGGSIKIGAKHAGEVHGCSGFANDIVLYNGVNRGSQSNPSDPFGL